MQSVLASGSVKTSGLTAYSSAACKTVKRNLKNHHPLCKLSSPDVFARWSLFFPAFGISPLQADPQSSPMTSAPSRKSIHQAFHVKSAIKLSEKQFPP